MLQLYTVKNFTGRMITEGDPSDLRPEDAVYLENLIADNGMLKLIRDRVECNRDTQKTQAHSQLYNIGSWFDPDGNLVLFWTYENTNTYIAAYYGSSISLGSSLAAEIVTAGSINSRVTVAIPYKNIVRIGCNATNFPSAIGKVGGSLTLFTENVDGEGYGVLVPVVFSNTSITNATGLKASAATYGHHDIGQISVSQNTDGKFPTGTYIWYGYTFVYDDNQESPMERITTNLLLTSTNTGILMRLVRGTNGGSHVDLDERIVAINVYRATGKDDKISAAEFYFLYRIDITNGVVDDSGTSNAWTTGPGGGGIDANLEYIDFLDYGYARADSYPSRTRYYDYNIAHQYSPAQTRVERIRCILKWDIGCITNGRAFVNVLAHWEDGKETTPNKTIAYSEPDKPDVFLPESRIQMGEQNGDPFLAMTALGDDRIAIWDKHNTYIVNVANNNPVYWFQEKVHPIGLHGLSYGVHYAPDGAWFCNKSGLYFLNQYGAMTELSRTIRQEWRNRYPPVDKNPKPFYDRRNNILYQFGLNASGDSAEGLAFDNEYKSLTLLSDDRLDDVLGNADTSFSGFNNVPTIVESDTTAGQVNIGTIADQSGSLDISYKSPHIDFGAYSYLKRGKVLYVKYKSAVAITPKIYLDHGSAITLTTLALSATVTIGKLSIPYDFRTFQLELLGTENTGVFELYEWSVKFAIIRDK